MIRWLSSVLGPEAAELVRVGSQWGLRDIETEALVAVSDNRGELECLLT